jgi:uncharacterized Zn finger protein (UPF0148 family)
MPAIAVICVTCGVTLFRHPAMRTRRVVCFECQKKKKNTVRKLRRGTLISETLNRTKSPEIVSCFAARRVQ